MCMVVVLSILLLLLLYEYTNRVVGVVYEKSERKRARVRVPESSCWLALK